MEIKLTTLRGETADMFYQLGLKEAQSFLKLEEKANKLISSHEFLVHSQALILRLKNLMAKKDDSFFYQCISAYAEGMGISTQRYLNFISLIELAAHAGEFIPELKSLLPGCSSVFYKKEEAFFHARLLDFPITGPHDFKRQNYLWLFKDHSSLITMGFEGMAPLFFQGMHESGFSFALHHLKSRQFYDQGESIFKLLFEGLFEVKSFQDLKQETKKYKTLSKWSILCLSKLGQVSVSNIEGPNIDTENYHLNETSPLIFTNIPLKLGAHDQSNFVDLCEMRQNWIKQNLFRIENTHALDVLTDVEKNNPKKWTHPAATHATIGAYLFNLSSGEIDLKDGDTTLTKSDSIYRLDFRISQDPIHIKPMGTITPFENAWKRASLAQGLYDSKKFDEAYHELQMAISIMPDASWKSIYQFFLYVWDFQFLTSSSELSSIYRNLKNLELPLFMNNHKFMMLMRLEKKLKLVPTIDESSIGPGFRSIFKKEKLATAVQFATWMKILYPRLENLDIILPYQD